MKVDKTANIVSATKNTPIKTGYLSDFACLEIFYFLELIASKSMHVSMGELTQEGRVGRSIGILIAAIVVAAGLTTVHFSIL